GDAGGREPVTVGPYELPPAFFEDLEACDTTGDAASPVVPTLLVQGTADQAVPVAVSQRYAEAIEAAGGAVRRVMVEGAGHVFGEPTHQRRVVEAVASFFREKLVR
ncbi:MAG: alpha/beta hydrolase family protein, partial [Phycisphaeraceae bacterium]